MSLILMNYLKNLLTGKGKPSSPKQITVGSSGSSEPSKFNKSMTYVKGKSVSAYHAIGRGWNDLELHGYEDKGKYESKTSITLLPSHFLFGFIPLVYPSLTFPIFWPSSSSTQKVNTPEGSKLWQFHPIKAKCTDLGALVDNDLPVLSSGEKPKENKITLVSPVYTSVQVQRDEYKNKTTLESIVSQFSGLTNCAKDVKKKLSQYSIGLNLAFDCENLLQYSLIAYSSKLKKGSKQRALISLAGEVEEGASQLGLITYASKLHKNSNQLALVALTGESQESRQIGLIGTYAHNITRGGNSRQYGLLNARNWGKNEGKLWNKITPLFGGSGWTYSPDTLIDDDNYQLRWKVPILSWAFEKLDPDTRKNLHPLFLRSSKKFNNPKDEIDYYTHLINSSVTNSNVPCYHSKLAQAYERDNNLSNALNSWESAIKCPSDKPNHHYHYRLALLQEKNGSIKESTKNITEAIKHLKNRECKLDIQKQRRLKLGEYNLFLGQLLLLQNKRDDALKAFDEANNLNPKLEEARYHKIKLGVQSVEQKSNPLLIAGLEKEIVCAMNENSKSDEYKAKYTLLLGELLYNRGDFLTSKHYFNELISKGVPKGQELCLIDAYIDHACCEFNQNNYVVALEDYDKVIQLVPDKNKELKCLIYMNKAEVNLKLGKLEAAVNDYSEALKINSKNDQARYNRGLVLKKKGDLSEALNDFTKIIDLVEKDKVKSKYLLDSYNHRGLIYFQQGMSNPIMNISAFEDLQKVCASRKNNSYAHTFLGELALKNGKYDVAISSFQKTFSLLKDIPPKKMNSEELSHTLISTYRLYNLLNEQCEILENKGYNENNSPDHLAVIFKNRDELNRTFSSYYHLGIVSGEYSPNTEFDPELEFKKLLA